MTATQPDVRATHAYKVGAAKTVVDSLLDESYGVLPDAAMARLNQLRNVLRHGDGEQTAPVPDRCATYGYPKGRCVLPAGHWPEQPHVLDVHVTGQEVAR